MTNFNRLSTWAIGAFGTVAYFIAGEADYYLKILLAIIVIDIASGILKATKNRSLQSSKMKDGIVRKASIILAVILANRLDLLINPDQVIFTVMMISLSIGSESLSILENLSECGVKFPKVIREKILKMADPENKDGFEGK